MEGSTTTTELRLVATLKEGFVSDQGHLVLADTPVAVLGWAKFKEGMVRCACGSYILPGEVRQGERQASNMGEEVEMLIHHSYLRHKKVVRYEEFDD